ncbi:MAG: ABC transporter permease, partial [Lentisphaeraceae bacterium]|nr:ABC transporter permease [Lentisphaeraceae bacterium]
MFLFLSCICLGVAALVALRAFGDSVRDGIIEQSRSLLGGDLLVKSRQPIPDQLTKQLQSKSLSDTKEWRFASMAKFPNSEDNSRLIQLRGIEEAFPLYGNIDTVPVDATQSFNSIENSALIDESLILQFDIKVGDPIVLGKQTFKIAGYIKSLPGESFIVSELSPRVLIKFKDIPKTGLIGFGSRVKYRHYFKLPENTDKKALKNEMDDAQVDHGIRYETTEDRQEAIDKTLSNLFHFLNLVAFIALLLGGTGIGSAIRVHINSKLKNAAILRCLGASRSQALTIYFIQALIMGIVGGLIGSLFGLLLQEFIPALISSFLPITVETSFSVSALLLGTITGTIITVLFALTPLLKLNQLSAADSLKSELNINSVKTVWEIPIQLFLASLIVIFSILSASTFKIGLYMGLGMLGALCALALFAYIMIKLVKKTISEALPFVWKQGLKNLFRPQNQSLTLICSLGTGTFLICLLYLAQENMLYQVRKTENGNNPNLILFDIQTDQVAGIKNILKEKKLKAIDVIPIVGMQLKSIKGKPVDFWLAENKKVERKQR